MALLAALAGPVLHASAGAKEGLTERPATVYKKPDKKSRALYQLGSRQPVSILEERGEWLRVKPANQPAGWLKKSAVRLFYREGRSRKPSAGAENKAAPPERSKPADPLVGKHGTLSRDFMVRIGPAPGAKQRYKFGAGFPVAVRQATADWLKVADEINRTGWAPRELFVAREAATPKPPVATTPAPPVAAPPPPEEEPFAEEELAAAPPKRRLDPCAKYAEAVCGCHGQGSRECLEVQKQNAEALRQNRAMAHEVCQSYFYEFSCVQEEALEKDLLAGCPEVRGKKLLPLNFRTRRCQGRADRLTISEVWGTSELVAPGQTFAVAGEYQLRSLEWALVEFGPNGGNSRPCRPRVAKGLGKFAAAALIVVVEQPEANELQAALIGEGASDTGAAPVVCEILVEKP